jgi:hypothetical protein
MTDLIAIAIVILGALVWAHGNSKRAPLLLDLTEIRNRLR